MTHRRLATALFSLGVALACLPPGTAPAETASGHAAGMAHQPGMDHGKMDHGTMSHGSMAAGDTGLPSEPGQGAFAAISEIVAMLRADPATDWSKVDIAALRRHLVDMNRLVLEAEAVETAIPGGLSIAVSLAGPGGAAAGRMVPAHGPVLAAETDWQSSVAEGDGQLVWTVTSAADEAQIRALGFFGLMAVGDHHRAHHLGMATGRMHH